ncbi:MAG: hypothetical protein ABIK52_08410, partial [Bacteroidota bacterium]
MDNKLKVLFADLPAHFVDLVSPISLFVDELWMLKAEPIDPTKFIGELKFEEKDIDKDKIYY